ncbi:ubiquitin-associated domain-containing family protein [Striga asiatica]|uniref:Ubiquitin-associated domain-containing family protein n=1 Tax=Striga asiatica TaxID=4170 RepID=A0A5A7R2K5_STRAF|nr:ubiquitin-associated domain-containing family protein [Striga asiatica]
MNGSPSGFNNAPVTRVVVIASILFTVVFGIQGRSRSFKLVLSDPSLSILTCGPYGLIFSSFVPFYFDIPVSTQFRVFSLNFSDKTFIYLAGMQLFLSSWKRSLLPGLCGILAGSLYRLNVFNIRKLKVAPNLKSISFMRLNLSVTKRLLSEFISANGTLSYFPEFIASFFSRLSLPSIGNTSPTTWSSPNTGRQIEANYPAILSSTEPPEDLIATLVSMGFDRNSARQALIRARNDVNTATNILLESQGH